MTMRLFLSVLVALWILQIADTMPHRYYEEDDDKALYDPNLFEGDIEITQEQYQTFYGQPQNGIQRETRAAQRDKTQLWPYRTLYYTFDATIDDILYSTIQQAMNTYKQLSCIKFVQHMNQKDYVRFRSRSTDVCSSHVGRKGGEQTIKIGPRCNRQRTILHEMLHALGVWHEQSRPDRDNFVQVFSDNIEDGREHNFLKRNKFEVDSQGEGYDYASVMHYRVDSFNKEDGLDTLKVTNQRLYTKQGSPDIGRLPTLSKSDVTQLNRLYNCPGSGVPGNLSVVIQSAQNLPYYDDPYVLVTAYTDVGHSMSKVTKYFRNTRHPNWNARFNFGVCNNWQYVDVSIWDYDFQQSSDDQLTSPQTFSINPGVHDLQHCGNKNCYRKMSFSISLQEVCYCLNGGVCHSNSHCFCVPGYGGPNCQYLRGQLTISEISGKNLVNLQDNTSIIDPYIIVLAFDHNGGVTERRTDIFNDTLNPVWNESLEFGENEWAWFTLQAFDHNNSSRDYLLSYAYTYVLQSSLSPQIENMTALDGGSITFSYSMETLAVFNIVTNTLSYSWTRKNQTHSQPGPHINCGVSVNEVAKNVMKYINVFFICLVTVTYYL